MTCAEPGCGGTVVDGYCDVCGTAPAPDAPAASQPVSTATAASASATPSARTASVRTSRTGPSTKGSSRGRLGAGIVEIPRIPKGDPAAAILTDPQVPEAQPVLRQLTNATSRSDAAGTDNQGAPRASAPSAARDIRLFPSFLVATWWVGSTKCRDASRTAASAGSTWRSTATSHNRWVVLKGLLNSGDADAMAAAKAEVLALAEVEHPNIVRIYNFVEHPDSAGVPVGYIVMEFVGGTSLKQIRKAHNAPLPPESGRRLHRRDRSGPRLPARARTRLLRLQAGQRDAGRRTAQAHRPRRGAPMDDEESAIYGTRRLPGARDRRHGSHRRQRRVHRRPDTRRSRDGCPAGEGPVRRPTARPRNGAGAGQARIVVSARSCVRRTTIPTGASRPWRSWRIS